MISIPSPQRRTLPSRDDLDPVSATGYSHSSHFVFKVDDSFEVFEADAVSGVSEDGEVTKYVVITSWLVSEAEDYGNQLSSFP